jgi:hypothetical protein
VVFPASALARKGVRELALAMRQLGWRLVVLGTPSTHEALWAGVHVEHASYASDWLSRADVVALPAHVEHSPRALLLAAAQGLPVVATAACGLPRGRFIEVPAGDPAALCLALRQAVALRRSSRCRTPPQPDAILKRAPAATWERRLLHPDVAGHPRPSEGPVMNTRIHQPDDDARRRDDKQDDPRTRERHPSGHRQSGEGGLLREEPGPADKGPGSASADTGMTSDGRKR